MNALAHRLHAQYLGIRPEHVADEALVARALEGDQAAFTVLFERHSGRVLGLTTGMLRNGIDAQDALQDTFLNAWRKLHTFRGDAAFSSWLYRIAHNTCLMRLRSQRRRPEVPLEIQLGHGEEPVERPLEDPSRTSDQLVENDELGRAIDAAVAELPSPYRDVFLLADTEHLSMRDIADELALTVPNVKTRLHRARLRLRSSLTGYLAAEPVAARVA